MERPPWSTDFAVLKAECVSDINDLLEKYPNSIVYETMSALLRKQLHQQFADEFAATHQEND
ncbi:hypothetical protein AUR66_18270 [Haloferax profundi]|uniref:Uncharacterized protein n=1 Tax=Haloferax profundi TaxID=1544718 RepID=A0A0W1RZ09_9EURY|nr:hypothetical protein AUR66_18270 [Haloferax profundi]